MATSLLPDCEISERIGEGGIADVFRGTWQGQEVALKVLRDPDRAGLRKRFIREGRMLQRLSHPGLVRCLDVIGEDQPVLVLELLTGSSLDIRLRAGPLDAESGVALASSVLRTLGYLHENGVVHRDIKAGNLWVGADGRMVVMDLGLASDVADPLTTTLGDVLGTHAYMAPEQIAGAETDHRCDLYSLGITLYEAMCGERPYRAHGLAGYLQAHRTAAATPIVERLPTIPVRLAALIDRLMARDPAARPASAAVALALLTGSSGVRRQLEPPRVIGRDGLAGAVSAVLDGGGVLRVSGELGSGLGAAARMTLELAREEGVEYAAVRCRARAVLSETIAAFVREVEAVLGPIVPDLVGLREAIAVAVVQEGRFLVLVEDLDLAPEGVAAFLERLADLPGLAMVVTGRSLPEQPPGREIALRPLTLHEVRGLLGGMLGTPTLPTGLDVAMLRVTGGLPALLVAVLREQVARGAIWCDRVGEGGRPRWAWDPSSRLLPGEDMTRVFERWLQNLVPATRSIIQALALAGGPVPLDLLLRAADADPSGSDLGPALRNGLCLLQVRDGEEWVSFRRAVLEPLVVRAIDEDSARDLHFALADAVRLRPGREWEQRFLILHSALGARDPEETGRLVELGDWLVAGGRPVEALGTLDAAEGLPIEDPAVVATLALARSDALCSLGRLPEARAAMEAGRSLATELGDPDLLRRATLAQVEVSLALAATVPGDARDVVEAAAVAGSARALGVVAAMLLLEGHLDAAEAWSERALDRAPPGPVDRVAVAARLCGARIVCLRGDLPRATALYRGLAAELRSVDRSLAACDALVGLAEVQRLQARVAAALDTLRTAQDLVTDRGYPWCLARLAIARAAIHLDCGDPEHAATLLLAHAGCAEPLAPWPVRRAYLATLAALREANGDTPAALAAHLRVVEAAAALPDQAAHAFHGGMVGILTANVSEVSNAVDVLAALGIPDLQARLLALGGQLGRDAELLAAAEGEARVASNQVLLLSLLHARRASEDRHEARAICATALDGLYGDLRERFLARPAVRWALGERVGDRRDTGV
jgi:tRNA A-37 threonylcarbamoyl transferase component Bud32